MKAKLKFLTNDLYITQRIHERKGKKLDKTQYSDVFDFFLPISVYNHPLFLYLFASIVYLFYFYCSLYQDISHNYIMFIPNNIAWWWVWWENYIFSGSIFPFYEIYREKVLFLI